MKPGRGKRIDSSANDIFRGLKRLKESRDRQKQGLFLIEGLRELELAFLAGVDFSNLVVCPELMHDKSQTLLDKILAEKTQRLIEMPKELFNQLIMREDRDGLLGVGVTPKLHADVWQSKISQTKTPFILVLDGVEKPGNLGAILRSADGAGVHGVVVLGGSEIFHPHVIRSSLGAVFSLNIVAQSIDELTAFCAEKKIAICVASQSERSKSLWQIKFDQALALVLGSEAFGVSKRWQDLSCQFVEIPMQGSCDSLNVSVAAGVLFYEVLRQRSFG